MRLLKTAVFTAMTVALAGQAQLSNQIQIDPFKNQPPGVPVPAGGPQAFKDGKLYYNNVPSTPAQGSVVKIIDSKRDTDYLSKVYTLKTKGNSAEIASYLRTTVEKSNGKVDVSVDAKTGVEFLSVTAPDYQLPFVEEMIATLDRDGTKFRDDGTKIGTYKLKNRLASDIGELVVKVLKSKDSQAYADNTVNKLYYVDDPSYFDSTIKYIQEFDVPPETGAHRGANRRGRVGRQLQLRLGAGGLEGRFARERRPQARHAAGSQQRRDERRPKGARPVRRAEHPHLRHAPQGHGKLHQLSVAHRPRQSAVQPDSGGAQRPASQHLLLGLDRLQGLCHPGHAA